MIKNILATTIIVSICLFMVSCITTTVKGYTDRAYSGYHIQKVIVRAPNAGFVLGELIEKKMADRFKETKVNAESFMERFPPTREWTNGEVAQELIKEGFDSIMYVVLTGSESSTQTIGYINSGQASAYGNTASYSGFSVPVSAIRRYTATRVNLYDAKTAKVIWVGDTSTEAGGFLFMSDDTQADSIANEVIISLASNGHL